MKIKQKKQRLLVTLMMALILANCSKMAVFAAGDIGADQTIEFAVDDVDSVDDTRQSTTYLVTDAGYSWNQNTTPVIIFPEFQCDNATNINIYFECIARSTNAGTFHVKLQKRGAFGIWSTISNVYTASQHDTQSYNVRTGQYVQGAWSRFDWNVGDGGRYRIVIEDATNKQGTELKGVYIWKRQ